MINQNQPIPPSAGLQFKSWIRPTITSILAVGMLLNVGVRSLRAQQAGTNAPYDGTPAIIIDDEIQALGFSQSSVSLRYGAATAAQLTTALDAAIDEFPAPNVDTAEDNPGYSPYTAADLTNYMLTTSTNYLALAPTLVKSAIAEETLDQTVYSGLTVGGAQYSGTGGGGILTDGIIEKITAGAAAIVADRLGSTGTNATYNTPAKLDTAIATAISALITNSAKVDPGDATGILQAVVNEIKTPPTFPSQTLMLTGTTMSQLQSVDAVEAVIKAVPTTSMATAATTAITSVGSFVASTTGTGLNGSGNTPNQNFVIAMIKAYANTAVPNLAEAETLAGEAVQTGGAETTATGAALYAAPIINGVGGSVAGISQAISSNISGVVAQSLFAQLLTSGSGAVLPYLGAAKATAATDGSVLGGVIANNPSAALTYLTDSGIYTYINSIKTLATNTNRIGFLNAALTPVASSTSAIAALVSNTILTSTGFTLEALKTQVTDFESLAAGAAKAVLASAAGEAQVVNSLYNEATTINTNLISSNSTTTNFLGIFAAKVVQNATTSGASGIQAFLTDAGDTTAASAILETGSIAGGTAGVFAVTDTERAQILNAAINIVQLSDTGALASNLSTDLKNAYTTVASVTQATTDTARATFSAAAINPYVSNESTVDSMLSAAFANTGGGAFASPSAAAGTLAKLLPVANATDVATEAGDNQTGANQQTNDEQIGAAILSVATVKANTALVTSIVQDIAGTITSGSLTSSGYAASLASGIMGTTLTTLARSISEGVANQLITDSASDSALETYAETLSANLLALSPPKAVTDQVAGGVAAALTTPSDAAALADLIAEQNVTSNVTLTAALREKIGAAVAFSQPAQGSAVVAALISGSTAGSGQAIPLDNVLADKEGIGAAVVLQAVTAAPGSAAANAGAIASVVANTLSTDTTGFADIGALDASLAKALPLTLSASVRAAAIAGIVDNSLSVGTGSIVPVNQTTILSSSANVITYLVKAEGAGATGGDLIAKEVALDMGFTPTVSGSLSHFTAAVGLKAAAATVYVAEGFAEYLGGSYTTFAQSVAVASGTAAAAASVKEDVAQGVALAAAPSQAATIASLVSATVTDGNLTGNALVTAQKANDTIRIAIATDVAKSVPNQGLNIAYDIALQLDNPSILPAATNSYASLVKAVAGVVSTTAGSLTQANVVSKVNLGAELGAVASEVLLAANQASNPLSLQEYAAIILAAANVKAADAYDVIGASIATAATFLTNAQLATGPNNLESLVEAGISNATAAGATEQNEAINAVSAYTNKTDHFDSSGTITQPETGIQNS